MAEMSRQKAVTIDVVRDHRPDGESGDLTTCRCNGVAYETADWAAHVADAIAEAIQDDRAAPVPHPAATDPSDGGGGRG